MNRKFLFGVPVAASLLLAICANAATTTKDIDIVVMHGTGGGTAITTMTIQNGDPSHPIVPGASGYPYIAGQAFVRSNGNGIASTGINSYPTCEDAGNNAPLACQWDDIATHRENGDDGSWRHATLTVLLPATSPQYSTVTGGQGLAPCATNPCSGTFQVKLVNASGTYAPSVHGSISDICNGHDIKLVMTDVRNQDDTLRGPSGHTGTLTFDTCAAINNSGRDAPRQFAQGAVRNGWLVQGPPRYSDGSADPLLYVKCYMSQTYTLSGALGPLQHMCSIHNSWMNVAAGSVGNSGTPGPVGFANDPQAVSYRPVLYDGATTILDWGTAYFDETVPDTALNTSSGMWTISALGNSHSNKAWGRGNAFRYSDSATPPVAVQGATTMFQQGQIIYACAATLCGNPRENLYDATHQLFSKYLWAGKESMPTYTAAGTGNSTFSWRVQHTKWAAWWTVDVTGYENWSPAGSTTRYASLLSPQLTASEKTYWKQTGTVAALQDQSPSNFAGYPDITQQENTRYAPLDLVGFQLGTGVGGRADIGLHNEYFAEAWSAQTPAYWQFVRALALVGMAQPQGDILNEVTARVPAINNGRPGSNHAGNGTPYAGLGAVYPGTDLYWNGNWPSGAVGVALPREGVPYNDCSITNLCTIGWADGFYTGPQDNSHQSAYAFGPYQIFGNEMYLEALQDAAERAMYYASGGCYSGFTPSASGDNLGCTFNGTTYYNILTPGDERRGSAWAIRDVAAAAAFGSDSLPERTYFNDDLNETYWFNVACGIQCGLIDPPSPTSGIALAAAENGSAALLVDDWAGAHALFMDSYFTKASYVAWGELHTPIAKDFLSMMYRSYSMMCGDNIVANSPSSMFCANYYYEPVAHSLTPLTANAADGADFGYDVNEGNTSTFTAGSQVISNNMPSYLLGQTFTSKIKFFNFPGCSTLPDQITDGQWYYLVNNTATPGSFEIATTSNGAPLGPFTTGGNPYSGTPCNALVRWDASVAAVGPTAGQIFISPGYASYSRSAITALVDINQSLGNIFPSAAAVLNNVVTRYNDNTQGWTDQNVPSSDTRANDWWDSNVSVQ